MLQKIKDLKKNLLRLRETRSFKTKLSKKTIKMSEKWIEMIEESETAIKINHENLLWTTCSDDQCRIHRSFKKKRYMVSKKEKKIGKKPCNSNKFYPTETPVTAVTMIKIKKSEIPALITQNTENIISISFANRMKKHLDNECIRIGEKIIQHVTIEWKHRFLRFTNFRFKKNSKNFVVLGQQ